MATSRIKGNRRNGMNHNHVSDFVRRNSLNKNFNLIQPEEIKVNFDEIFGHEESKKEFCNIISYLQNPEPFKRFGVLPYTKYYLAGVGGCGKATLVCSIAKKVGLPIIVVEPSFFFNTEAILDELDEIFEIVYTHIENGTKCILLFKDIQNICPLEPKVEQPLIERLLGYFRSFPELVAFATISTDEEVVVSEQLILPPAFSKGIELTFPNIKVREQILSYFLKDIPTDKSLDISRLAADLTDMPTGYIKHIIKDAALICMQNQKNVLSYNEFAEAMAQLDFGYADTKHSKKERLITARHEAGHVVAGYFADPKNYRISKVDITPRAFYGGITSGIVDEDKLSYFKEDLENQIISLMGGMASEELFYGSTTTGVSNDLSQATQIALHIHKKYGMNKEIGPICLFFENIKFTELSNQADAIIKCFMKDIYLRTQKIVRDHKSEINALVDALLKKEVLYTDEIMAILTKNKRNSKKK